MTRAVFLYLSQHAGLRRWMERNASARKITRRFIAGETLEEGLAVCEELSKEGILTALDHLGENVSEMSEAVAARDAYLSALQAIVERGLKTTISLKLTALGMDLSEAAAEEHLRTLALSAKAIGSYVEIDMEDTRYTEATVRIAEAVGSETGSIRVAIQAYLHRTPRDIERLNKARVMVRLCKGAYIEPEHLAIQQKSGVDQAYLAQMKKLLEEGTYPALATHNELIIGDVQRYLYERKLNKDRFEFEMLHGVRRDLQRILVSSGYKVRVYVPYGSQWYRYFMRRLAERPANVWFVARNLFK